MSKVILFIESILILFSMFQINVQEVESHPSRKRKADDGILPSVQRIIVVKSEKVEVEQLVSIIIDLYYSKYSFVLSLINPC